MNIIDINNTALVKHTFNGQEVEMILEKLGTSEVALTYFNIQGFDYEVCFEPWMDTWSPQEIMLHQIAEPVGYYAKTDGARPCPLHLTHVFGPAVVWMEPKTIAYAIWDLWRNR